MLIVWIYLDILKAERLNLRSTHSLKPNVPLESVSQLPAPTLRVQAPSSEVPEPWHNCMGSKQKAFPTPQPPGFRKFSSSHS